MYRCVEKLVSWTIPLLMAAVLSACGGAPADSESQPSSANNKPSVDNSSSLQASSEQKSSITPLSSSSLASSSATLPISSSSKSSTDTYTRASRASTSAVSSEPQDSTDTTPPSTPQLQLYRLSESSTTVAWEHAIDDVAMRSYKIYRNGKLAATLDYPMSAFADSNLLANTAYVYTIIALDTNENPSPISEPLTIHTLESTNHFPSSASSASQSSASITSSSSATSKTNNSSTTSKASSSSITSKASSSGVASSALSRQTLTLSWSHPTKRENGNFIELDEIGGYEIRFKQNPTSNYIYLTLNGSKITSYSTTLIPTNSPIEIAVYDTDGLFSEFVAITATY